MYEGTKQAERGCVKPKELDSAFGAMRDGLAALTNLKNILHSARIGWRPVAEAIADMRPVSESIRDAFSLLIRDLEERLDAPACLGQLSQFVTVRLNQLDRELAIANAEKMRAKTRLRLESEVVRLDLEMDSVRQVVELLDHATNRCMTELDPRAVLQGGLALLATREGDDRTVTLSITNAAGVSTGAAGNPQAIIPLLATSIGLLAHSGAEHIHISVRASQRKGLLFSLSGAPPPSRHAVTQTCSPPPVIPLTADLASLAASVSGVVFTFSTSPQHVTLQVPPGRVSSVILRSDAPQSERG